MVASTPQVDPAVVLDVRNVDKFFGRRQVLSGITLGLRTGRIVGVTGENGAGKSTLLKIIVGLLAPTSGEVSIHGRIGFCPQELMLFEALTVDENLAYFARAYGLHQSSSRGAVAQRKADLLHRLNFAQYQYAPVTRLSGGTKQKLNLALALLHAPDILVLDEPYAGFDWETYVRFWELAEELRAGGRSILIVSHLVHERSRFDGLFEIKGGVLRCV